MKHMKMKIFEEDWDVYLTDSLSPGLRSGDDICLGTCWHTKCEIYLSDSLKGFKAESVIRHELAHAFIHSTQANTPKEWTEEALCDLIGIYGKQISDISQRIYDELYREN